ncbi:GDSL-like Lipase/Acylhydrolase family protein [Candidatus Bilamarchaeum dharawalense]|uniref:GDSL-like Lipase/Acylhydrolase family protein n=1 Tax=Candidatus Bilamarchaeum dharawalense TaxID=2885759 RepID=A0A5E4LPG7_9ARCH|nr:GDSL-like Lipase/Acylhydrolase family protein [Candidatus Bilamarchaeum dharawalense]
MPKPTAGIALSGNTIVIIFTDGERFSTSQTLSAQEREDRSKVDAKVNAALDEAYRHAQTQAKKDELLNDKRIQQALWDKLHPKVVGAPKKTGPGIVERVIDKGQELAAEAERRRQEQARKREETRRPTDRTASPGLKKVDQRYILQQIAATDRAGTATTLVTRKEEIDGFLKQDQRGTERTKQQRETTVAIFNELAANVPAFKAYLKQMAATQRSEYPEFVQLFVFTQDQNAKLDISTQAEILRAADLFIRYFLINFGANTDPSFRREIEQLVGLKAILDESKPLAKRLAMGGTIDSDTMAAAELYIRRWQLIHPKKGAAQKADEIPVWEAPRVVVEEAPAEAMRRVAIIGDSISADGVYGQELQKLLRQGGAKAAVEVYGVNGDTSYGAKTRFRRDVLGKKPPYDTVIIQIGVNDIAQRRPVTEIQKNIREMIEAAQQAGMRVVILTVTPWQGTGSATERAIRDTAQLNEWLLAKTDPALKDVTVVDMKSLGNPTNPAELAPAYRDGAERLHPNEAGKREMARVIAASPAFGVTDDRPVVGTVVQTTDLANAARSGSPDPAKIVELTQAPTALKKEEIGRSFVTVINEDLLKDGQFVEFMKRKYPQYCKKGEVIRLASDAPEAAVRVYVKAVQEFLNEQATADYRLGKDIAKLYQKLGMPAEERIRPDPANQLLTLNMIALYQWRKLHRTEEPGKWGERIGVPVDKPNQPLEIHGF